tara:strand:+ start:377 stop:529 length:153 start_codon:yes stop_codon:yes gene_type:complete
MDRLIQDIIAEVEGTGFYSEFDQEERVRKFLKDLGFKEDFSYTDNPLTAK